MTNIATQYNSVPNGASISAATSSSTNTLNDKLAFLEAKRPTFYGLRSSELYDILRNALLQNAPNSNSIDPKKILDDLLAQKNGSDIYKASSDHAIQVLHGMLANDPQGRAPLPQVAIKFLREHNITINGKTIDEFLSANKDQLGEPQGRNLTKAQLAQVLSALRGEKPSVVPVPVPVPVPDRETSRAPCICEKPYPAEPAASKMAMKITMLNLAFLMAQDQARPMPEEERKQDDQAKTERAPRKSQEAQNTPHTGMPAATAMPETTAVPTATAVPMPTAMVEISVA
jgi:hypothetical protein